MKTFYYRFLSIISILRGENVLIYQKYNSSVNKLTYDLIIQPRKSNLKIYVNEKNFQIPNIRNFNSKK